jgi:hypothetical protein
MHINGHVEEFYPQHLFEMYIYVCHLMMLAFAHPVLLWHALDIVTPLGLPNR